MVEEKQVKKIEKEKPKIETKPKASKEQVLEGAEELLTEWAYSLNELGAKTREGYNDFKEIERATAVHWFDSALGKLPKVKTAYEATTKFRDLADSRNVIQKANFELEEKNEIVIGTFLSHDCPYKKCCALRKKEGKKYFCLRAAPFVIAIELMASQNYKSEVIYEQTFPGKSCLVQGIPSVVSFTVGLSYKLSRGTIKIHDLDAGKIGIDLIDNIVVKPERKGLEGKKLTAMSYTQTKYPPGMIIMNIQDAKTLGLLEKDTVMVTKAGEGEKAVSLVDTSKYEAKPGEYGEDVEDIEGELEKEYGEVESLKEEKPAEKGEEKKDKEIEEVIEDKKIAHKKDKELKPKIVKKSVMTKKPAIKKPKAIQKPVVKKPIIEKPVSKPVPKPKEEPKQNKDFEAQIEALRNA